MSVDLTALRALLDGAPDGVTICGGRDDFPVLYANRAMEALTGYPTGELLGKNLRLLQAEDRDQEGLTRIRTALREASGCQAVLRNYRRDGTQFWNEVTLIPLRDSAGAVTHFAAFHRDGAERQRNDIRAEHRDPSLNTQTMLTFVREDKLTGLLRRPYFEELLKRDWGLAQRDSRRLTMFIFDLDFFKPYQDVFGRSGADQCFRRISRVIGGCFRRASDLCGRFSEDQIVALAAGMSQNDATKFAETVLTRVRDLAIHHPRSSVSRFITATVGGISRIPAQDAVASTIVEDTLKAVQEAKLAGRNRALVHEL